MVGVALTGIVWEDRPICGGSTTFHPTVTERSHFPQRTWLSARKALVSTPSQRPCSITTQGALCQKVTHWSSRLHIVCKSGRCAMLSQRELQICRFGIEWIKVIKEPLICNNLVYVFWCDANREKDCKECCWGRCVCIAGPAVWRCLECVDGMWCGHGGGPLASISKCLNSLVSKSSFKFCSRSNLSCQNPLHQVIVQLYTSQS